MSTKNTILCSIYVGIIPTTFGIILTLNLYKGVYIIYYMGNKTKSREGIKICLNCKYSLFQQIDKINFKCEKCGEINNFLL